MLNATSRSQSQYKTLYILVYTKMINLAKLHSVKMCSLDFDQFVALNIGYLKIFVPDSFETLKYKFYMFKYKELHVARSILVLTHMIIPLFHHAR
jgi:hypothetical protein